jgi:hypothetical protein
MTYATSLNPHALISNSAPNEQVANIQKIDERIGKK